MRSISAWAISASKASRPVSALIVSANPVFTAVLAALFLGERLTWRKVAGFLLGVGGVAFIVGIACRRHRQPARDHVHAGGAGLARRRHHPVQGVGAEGRPVARQRRADLAGRSRDAAVRFDVSRCRGHRAELASARRVCLSGAVRSIVAYVLWFHLLKVWGATAASAYHFLMPPLAMLFGWLLLGEHVAVRDLLGIIPVALGIYLVTRPAAGPAQRVS